MTRRSHQFYEEKSFNKALDKFGIPAVMLDDYEFFRKLYHIGVKYGEDRMKKDAQRSRQRLAEFIVKSGYVDRVLNAELRLCDEE